MLNPRMPVPKRLKPKRFKLIKYKPMGLKQKRGFANKAESKWSETNSPG